MNSTNPDPLGVAHVLGEDVILLEGAIEIAERSRQDGNHPFGAVLVLAGEVILAAGNTVVTESDVTGHAELNLVRAASSRHDRQELARMTLYSSCEPCAMCAGGIYWSGIGRLVYALSETELLEFTGDSPENPTMSLPCRSVLAAGQRVIDIVGPVDLRAAREVHAGFWTKGDRGA